jgi:hypothetical protein
MYAFWRWPVWAETSKGSKINYLTHVTLDGNLTKIIINTSVIFVFRWTRYEELTQFSAYVELYIYLLFLRA